MQNVYNYVVVTATPVRLSILERHESGTQACRHAILHHVYMDAVVASLSVWLLKTKSSNLPLPLGPRQIPFLITALDIDISEPHVTYTQWGHRWQYGLSSAVNSQFH